jgi:4-hydroxysphinganine ceramide fatty acyl 2-hydroxylase
VDSKTHKPIAKEIDYKYEIDLKKGILKQVFMKMNKKDYLAFIHDPKHMISPPEAILFESPYLEVFTKTPWYVIPLLWVPLVLMYIYSAYSEGNVPLVFFPFLYIFGIFVWTFIEYFLHRFVFHLDDNVPDNRLALMTHFLFHGIHHAFPMDKNRLVFPPVAAIPLYYAVTKLLSLLFGKYYLIIEAGTITGYIMYDLTHYYIHHNKPGLEYYRHLKQHHVLHHYNNPRRGFGVSSRIWDYVFGTVLKVNGK